jgi:hypothetical protein
MVKIIEMTELTPGLTSFRTQIGSIDTGKTLQDRYQYYRDLLRIENQLPTCSARSDPEGQPGAEE